jgi:type IV secretory pathway VirB3-like protein
VVVEIKIPEILTPFSMMNFSGIFISTTFYIDSGIFISTILMKFFYMNNVINKRSVNFFKFLWHSQLSLSTSLSTRKSCFFLGGCPVTNVRQVGGEGGSRKNSRRKKYKGKKGRNGRKSITRGGGGVQKSTFLPHVGFWTAPWEEKKCSFFGSFFVWIE